MLDERVRGLGDVFAYYPTLATIVTSRWEGKSNAMAVAWHVIVSMNPPQYGVSIAPKRFTHDLIKRSGCFAVNFLPGDEADLVAAVGGCSGRDIDKFDAFGIETVPSLEIDVPLIKKAYAALECKLVSTLNCADHDWLVGQVKATHYSRNAFDEHGFPKLEFAKPLSYMGKDKYLMMKTGELQHLDRKVCVERKKTRQTNRT